MKVKVEVKVEDGKVVVLVGDPALGAAGIVRIEEGASMDWIDGAPGLGCVENNVKRHELRQRSRYGFGNV